MENGKTGEVGIVGGWVGGDSTVEASVVDDAFSYIGLRLRGCIPFMVNSAPTIQQNQQTTLAFTKSEYHFGFFLPHSVVCERCACGLLA